MTWFVDTNICISFLNDTSEPVADRFVSADLDSVKIPSVVAAELLFGAQKSAKREHNLSRVRLFVQQFEVVHFGLTAAEIYGEIRAHLERAGQMIGWNDLFIAATTMAGGGTLVTNNTREFERVPGLDIVDWTIAQAV